MECGVLIPTSYIYNDDVRGIECVNEKFQKVNISFLINNNNKIITTNIFLLCNNDNIHNSNHGKTRPYHDHNRCRFHQNRRGKPYDLCTFSS